MPWFVPLIIAGAKFLQQQQKQAHEKKMAAAQAQQGGGDSLAQTLLSGQQQPGGQQPGTDGPLGQLTAFDTGRPTGEPEPLQLPSMAAGIPEPPPAAPTPAPKSEYERLIGTLAPSRPFGPPEQEQQPKDMMYRRKPKWPPEEETEYSAEQPDPQNWRWF